ncbi:VWA domain-containing protein [Edaphobacillus lindanitolerans]|uniref:von Willebrand factor type A domain-containing protein n=1 Tax=Edaphobacillus lindanitolerans TaxID=550447 RepID=A0A1U7PHK7_9BACI|nr:VWA domain-containing protein [Edaphobacillus lindanitolerans]SIT68327.1 von Willebrand factor type A domain-containing protein [Edaphobacillus lindanitolerans]
MDFRIEQPFWLLLAIPAAVYFAWTYRRSAKGPRHSARVLLLLRTLAAFCLIVSAASPFLLLRSDEQKIFFLADRSASMSGSEEDVDAWLPEASDGRTPNSGIRVLSFAGSVREGRDDGGLKNERSSGGTGETNLEQAIRHAAAAAAGDPARIVLLSDGRQTRGDALGYVRSSLPPGITIDAAVLSGRKKEDASLTSLEVPSSGRAGEAMELTVTVDSTFATTGRLLLFKDDRPAGERNITLAAGENRFTFTEVQPDEGSIKYEVQIIAEGDGVPENNRMTAVTEIEGPPRFLVVGQDGAESPAGKWIGGGGVQVDRIGAGQLPNELSSYLAYDGIVFDNVPGHLVGEKRMGLINQAVKTFGTGFMMIGGEESFGLGGYFETPIEELLPVSMDVTGKHVIPSLGLMIVLDRSGSMTGSKLEMAKEAASRSVALLREEDVLGFIAFDDQPIEVIGTELVGDTKDALEKIYSIAPGGGTDIFPAVQLAVERLADQDVQRKHIILLTDGMSSAAGDYGGVLKEAEASGITMSTVAIGSDADRILLEQLAGLGAGRFYDVRSADTVPAILSRETAMLSRTYIVDEPFRPAVREAEGWRILTGELPTMNAYIATTVKPAADVIMESPEGDPVLAEWRYGLGRSIAYTPDSGGWSGGFTSWEGWPGFWKAAAARMLPSFREEPFEVRRNADGSYRVTGTGASSFIDAAVIDEDGRELEASVDPTGPGSATVRFDAQPGLVFFRISGDGETYSKIGLTVPYGDEYRPGAPDGELLAALAAASGGKVLDNPADALRTPGQVQLEMKPVRNWFLLLSMLLFFADITLRRFGVPADAIKLRRRGAEPGEGRGKETSHVEKLLDAKRKNK